MKEELENIDLTYHIESINHIVEDSRHNEQLNQKDEDFGWSKLFGRNASSRQNDGVNYEIEPEIDIENSSSDEIDIVNECDDIQRWKIQKINAMKHAFPNAINDCSEQYESNVLARKCMIYSERVHTHNHLERARRKTMASKFKILQKLVTDENYNGHMSKINILQATTSSINHLSKKNEQLTHQISIQLEQLKQKSQRLVDLGCNLYRLTETSLYGGVLILDNTKEIDELVKEDIRNITGYLFPKHLQRHYDSLSMINKKHDRHNNHGDCILCVASASLVRLNKFKFNLVTNDELERSICRTNVM